MTAFKEKYSIAWIPVTLGVVILVIMGFIIANDTHALLARTVDLPPTIDFTWTPAGAVDLKQMRGTLTMSDDYALDFKTYRMRLVELDKTIDLPIDGLIGKEYSAPVSFGLIADDPRLIGKDHLTVVISIADDKGQTTTLTRVIQLKR
jgi:hypothetical protein